MTKPIFSLIAFFSSLNGSPLISETALQSNSAHYKLEQKNFSFVLHKSITSIQDVEIVLTIVNDGVVDSELVLRAFGADSKNEWESILQGCKRNIGTSCCALD